MLTSKAFFHFDKDKKRFRLESIHPTSSLEDILDNTGFSFDYAEDIPLTSPPDPALLELLNRDVREKVAEVYPNFADMIFPVTSHAAQDI